MTLLSCLARVKFRPYTTTHLESQPTTHHTLSTKMKTRKTVYETSITVITPISPIKITHIYK